MMCEIEKVHAIIDRETIRREVSVMSPVAVIRSKWIVVKLDIVVRMAARRVR